MFDDIQVDPKSFKDYEAIIEPLLYRQVLDLAKALKGKRILEINATAHGGGVAEILHSQIALMQDLGLDIHWQVIKGHDDFYTVTKMLHNTMQGDKLAPTEQQWQVYEQVNQQAAAHLKVSDWDFILIHDPQPVALRSFAKNPQTAKWAWRCHIDTSFPNPQVDRRINRYLTDYDGAIFTMQQYIMPSLKGSRLAQHLGIIPVAIDPLSEKNRGVAPADARQLVGDHGIDLERPIVTQISRFDPWKDPLGVIEAWQQAREKVPGLQLVLMGAMADDDPEGAKILSLVKAAAKGQPDIFLITESNDRLVNSLQQLSLVVLQKSLREGFGLTVSEALWAGTPVIGGDVGGIPLQIEDGRSGFLVMTPIQAAERIVWLANHPQQARAMGQAGKEHVRKNFLLPRLIRDQLTYWLSL
jgi:trehalose synthase